MARESWKAIRIGRLVEKSKTVVYYGIVYRIDHYTKISRAIGMHITYKVYIWNHCIPIYVIQHSTSHTVRHNGKDNKSDKMDRRGGKYV